MIVWMIWFYILMKNIIIKQNLICFLVKWNKILTKMVLINLWLLVLYFIMKNIIKILINNKILFY